MSVKVGVLALQGDFLEHTVAMSELDCQAAAVKTVADVLSCDGLIIPGGESTTIGKLCDRFGVGDAIRELHAQGKPIWGTCAGAILLAKEIVESDQSRLGLMDIEVARNAFGRQVDSFETDLDCQEIPGGPVRAVFIRAPYITRVFGDARVLSVYRDRIVMARQGTLLASAFHPELTSDRRVHQYFLDMVKQARGWTGRPARRGSERMKGIIIVGGLGSRLRPMTRVTNKHLLPVWRFPMVYYPLHSLVDAGVRDVLIVTGGNSPGDFLELLHDGSDFGLRQLYFAYQAQPRGIADALRCAEHFVGGDSCILMLGDNILNGSIRPYVQRFEEQREGMRILLKQVPDPQRFGVPELNSQGNILRVIEKPEQPPSPYAIIGVYMMDPRVWGILPNLELSERNQYEITDVQNEYLRRGQLRHDVIECDWSDAGTPESLYRAAQMAHDSDFQPPAELAE